MLKTQAGKEGTGPSDKLKGQTDKCRRLMIRSCFCIIKVFISVVSAKADKKPKGSCINDGPVHGLRVYAEHFWLFDSGHVVGAAVANLLYKNVRQKRDVEEAKHIGCVLL